MPHVLGSGFVSARGALRAALASVLLVACEGADVTRTKDISGVAEAGETPIPDPAHVDTGEPPPAQPADTPAATGPTRPVMATPSPVVDAGATPGPDPVAFDCSTVPEAPVGFEELPGFTSSEDFVFDELGNYVGIDPNGNLIRISKAGDKQLWAPAIGSIAGMAILPDGSLVVCDVGHGALKRIYPNGAVTVIIGGLLYPNGLDVGPDGFVYVAENSAGRVRRVDPDTGEFSIVAMGLEGPNGVAFGNDPTLLYIGSFEGSGVYEVKLAEPGQLGAARVLARPNGSRLKDPFLACPQQEEGSDCETIHFTRGRCQALANVVDCMPVDLCPELPDESSCSYPEQGSCQNGRCIPLPNPCDGLREGDACGDELTEIGVCRMFGGDLVCGAPNPCDGLQVGDACEQPFAGTGVCDGFAGALYCVVPDPCEGRRAGDACEDGFAGAGTCVSFEATVLYCQPHNPCDGLRAGAACEDPYFGLGDCNDYGDGLLFCEPPNPCDGSREGSACEDPFGGPGICNTIQGELYCTPPNVCTGLRAGDACEDPFFGAGVCNASAGETALYCMPPNVCDGLSEGDACSEPLGGSGVCNASDGELYCGPPNVCAGLRAGDPCEDPFVPAGVCKGYEGSTTLYCEPPSPCEGLDDGAVCVDPFSRLEGTCENGYCSSSSGGPGGIDGMGVDACGNVYASEFTNGNVWRISPEGEIELLAQLPSLWIPNIKWGRDVGGFSGQVMYIADRQDSRLFAVSVGVPGATEFFALDP